MTKFLTLPTIFVGIFDNWKKDFRENKPVFFLELIGTLGCMVAAGSLALLAPHPNLVLTYSAYLVGSGSLVTSSYLRNNGFWVILNMFFMVADILGLWNTLTG